MDTVSDILMFSGRRAEWIMKMTCIWLNMHKKQYSVHCITVRHYCQ